MSETHSDSVEYGPQIRYKSCIVFEKTKISYVIWFEDALRHYGVPTALFDLYILLLDLGTAANALVDADGLWTRSLLIELQTQLWKYRKDR
jgi:hypothetical protein